MNTDRETNDTPKGDLRSRFEEEVLNALQLLLFGFYAGQTDDAFWARLQKYFSEPELVEIGYFIAVTMGQQRWLRILNIEHHQVLAGESGSMAPGFETEDALKRAKADPNYWAKKKPAAQSEAAE